MYVNALIFVCVLKGILVDRIKLIRFGLVYSNLKDFLWFLDCPNYPWSNQPLNLKQHEYERKTPQY